MFTVVLSYILTLINIKICFNFTHSRNLDSKKKDLLSK